MSDTPGTDPSLPSDVYESSRSRVPLITRDYFTDEEDKATFDKSNNDPRSIMGLRGPAGIGLYSPKCSNLQRPLNQYLRFESSLERKLAETVMLCAARAMDQPFEWSAHEGAGRKAGLDEAVIVAINEKSPTTGLPEKEAAIIELSREVTEKHSVSPETYAKMLGLFGYEQLVDICVLMGQYLSTAVLLHTFGQQMPPGVTSSLIRK